MAQLAAKLDANPADGRRLGAADPLLYGARQAGRCKGGAGQGARRARRRRRGAGKRQRGGQGRGSAGMTMVAPRRSRMTRKQRRLTLIGLAGVVLAVAAGLILYALSDRIVFFNSPTDVADDKLPARDAHPSRRHGRGRQPREGRRRQGQLRRHRRQRHGSGHLYRHPSRPLPRGAGGGHRGHRSPPAARSTPTRCWPSTTSATCPRRWSRR